jgi:hypothetical protein
MIQMNTGIVARNRNRLITICICLTAFATRCISPFEPDYKGAENGLLVVDGSLIMGFQTQEIRISRSTSILKPVFHPVEKCSVRIIDDSGTEFIFTEESPGKYVAKIDDALLSYNSQYKLLISTASGQQYESGFQRILETAPVDSVYAIKETHYISEADKYMAGLQFYVDLNAPDDASRYYRWQITETWEIHAWHKIAGVYDGSTMFFNPDNPSDSLYYCWDSKTASGIYTYSTLNLTHNRLRQVPLHFKAHDSPDMTIKYCATVRQFALDADAYYYWHQKEIELRESGQIYTTQPSQLKSNIFNTANPGEKVLGYFWVSSFTEKHLFEKNPFYNNIAIGPESCVSYGTCAEFLDENLINTLYHITQYTKNFPVPPVYMYYYIMPMSGLFCVYFTKDECIDCRRVGGNTHKPDFWE